MKNTLRKISAVLLALILTVGLIASAMADTVYITEGFTIPIGRIEGERPVTVTSEPTPNAPEDELVDPIGDPDELQETDEQKPEEALDENVEGLVVVEGEEKTEDASITEQTEVRTNIDDGYEKTLINVVGTNAVNIINEDVKTEQNTEEIKTATDADKIETIDEEKSDVEIKVTYKRDELGQLILDTKGNPIPIVPEGLEIPVKFMKDENGQLVLDEVGEPIPTETVDAGSQVMMSIEDQLDPNRSMDVYVTYDKNEVLGYGAHINMTVIMNGYDNLVYTLQWKYSKDGTVWYDCVGETQKTMRIQLSPDNVQNWWTVEAEITDVLSE